LQKLSITTAPLNRLIGRDYADLPSTIEVMQRLMNLRVVDGFEFQALAEWDGREPPRDEYNRDDYGRGPRHRVWEKAPKYDYTRLGALLKESSVPILSIHANRDVGICLCSGDLELVSRGIRLLHDTLSLAESVGAKMAVFHLWDTWNEKFDPEFLRRTLIDAASSHPDVIPAIENVPTHLPDYTPFSLTRLFDSIVLDTQWASMYDELQHFEDIKGQIVNVHLRGRLEGEDWTLDDAPFSFWEVIETIRDGWGYRGLFTLEPRGGLTPNAWNHFLRAMARLR